MSGRVITLFCCWPLQFCSCNCVCVIDFNSLNRRPLIIAQSTGLGLSKRSRNKRPLAVSCLPSNSFIAWKCLSCVYANLSITKTRLEVATSKNKLTEPNNRRRTRKRGPSLEDLLVVKSVTYHLVSRWGRSAPPMLVLSPHGQRHIPTNLIN